MTDQERAAFEKLIDAAKTLTNYNNVSFYYRKQGDWDRLKARIREADEVIKKSSARSQTEPGLDSQ